MNKTFPPEFRRLLADPRVKKAWVSDYEQIPHRCQNCGGSGTFNLFTALEGPYPQPCGPYSRYYPASLSAPAVYKVSKSEIINGHVMWWGGRSYDFPCPVCQGNNS